MRMNPKYIAVTAAAAAALALAIMIQKNGGLKHAFPARSLSSSEAEEVLSSEESLPPDETASAEESESASEVVSSEETTSEEETESIPKQTDDWNLLLVNSEHRIDQSFKPELAEVQNGYQMDKQAVDSAKRMIQDAKAQGVDLLVCSGYRSYESQQRHYQNSVDNLKAAGYSSDEAVRQTLSLIAYPGSSEHQTGLALDIVTPDYQSLDDGYAQTAAAKWLLGHAAEYGFILRFPKGKEAITKISFEPWHYRFVGEDAAREIMKKGICLEEYLSA